jgi:SAM-dependent methyltransferase
MRRDLVTPLRPIVARRDIRRRLRDCMTRFLRGGETLCDVGCGSGPFAGFLRERGVRYVGLDVPGGFYGDDATNVFAAADAAPLADGAADAVLSSQVIEHLPDPDAAVAEVARVLKPGGLFFASFPMLYPIHAAPHDYFRYTRWGFETMCARHGLEMVERHELSGFWYHASTAVVIHASVLNRPAFRGFDVGALATLPLVWLFWVFHKLETFLYAALGKGVTVSRRPWTVNYVYVARKTPPS